jgi:hypothetical protein
MSRTENRLLPETALAKRSQRTVTFVVWVNPEVGALLEGWQSVRILNEIYSGDPRWEQTRRLRLNPGAVTACG